tara:strand:- start:1496 stop:1828 length:333 start_codon:yes stop_codon:yes gene_type:complete
MVSRLKGNKKIDSLFDEGKSLTCFPLRVIYMKSLNLSWGVTVGKKRFPLAVTRNKIKRQLREGVKKHLLDEVIKSKVNLVFMVIYIGNEKIDQKSLYNSFVEIKKNLIKI